jgi:uncharacterized protein YndB with AHSA1/START domain
VTEGEPDPGRAPRRPLTTVARVLDADPGLVFAVLTDAWLMPVWVVGATHVRDVDDGWPRPPARMHHQVGPWPVSISDSTAVVACEPPHRFALQGRAWPLGELRIEFTVEPHGAGSLVRMAEAPSFGAARRLDNPVQRLLLAARNRESLDRFAAIVAHRRAARAAAAEPQHGQR